MLLLLRTIVAGLARRASHRPLRDRIAACGAILAFLMMASPSPATTILALRGDRGDAGFEDHCPVNQFLIGLAGSSGDWLDQIQIMCAPILPDGTQGARYRGPGRGGFGGSALEVLCKPNAFVTSVEISLTSDSRRVAGVVLYCTPLKRTASSSILFGRVDGSNPLDDCPYQDLASGFAGRYGRDVNALALICEPLGTAASAPPRCPSGFVWRVASPTDFVCVTPAQRTITAQENAAASAHVDPVNHAYGPNTCLPGYVWRQAYSGDTVCVTPQQRSDAADQNQNAPHA